MNARTTIVAVLLLGTAACCAQDRHIRTAADRKETVLFMGYRLELELDDVGTPIAAKAYNRENQPVRTVITQLREASVCPPKALDRPCEPLTFMPNKTNWKAGDNTTCYHNYNGVLVAYTCH